MKARSKALLLTLCAVMLMAASVLGTVAYLTDQTDAVVNTFTVGSIFDDDEDSGIVLLEHEAVDPDGDGVYALNTKEVSANTYVVYPGVNLPKDPFVRVTGLNAQAYLFVEVVDNTCSALTVTVDTAKWTATTLTGQNGGTVYVYAVNGGKLTQDLTDTCILADNKIDVADAQISDPGTVTFYAYIVQASGFASASAAWQGAFGA